MSVTDAYNLGPDNWAERSTHVVQRYADLRCCCVLFTWSYHSVDTEMPLPINAPDEDVESDAGFVHNCGTMSAFVRE